jgi:mono/diheme cytochrome c family protein
LGTFNIERRTSNIEGSVEVKLIRILFLVAGLVAFGMGNLFAGGKSAGDSPDRVTTGRTLFLKNCAHCHAEDATGDEGPDLHGLVKSDDWIARRIRNGVKGEMTAFGEKFSAQDVSALIAYLRTLK